MAHTLPIVDPLQKSHDVDAEESVEVAQHAAEVRRIPIRNPAVDA